MVDVRNSKTHKTYLSLSAEFYDLSRPDVPEKEFAFYMSYIREAKGLILEPMCGSGRFLIPIYESGFQIHGFDASSFMLERLHQKLRAINNASSGLKIWQGFLQDLNSPERYGLIMIPDGSFNLILKFEEIKLCLEKIYQHLVPGGRFVFELVTLQYGEQIEVGACNNFSLMRPDGKTIDKQITILPLEGQVARTKSYCELYENNKVLKIEVEDFHLLLHSPEEIDLLLKNTGFRDIKYLKAFDRTHVAGGNDAIMIIECTR